MLRDDFGPHSDIDVLASFDEAARHTLFDLDRMEEELTAIFGRNVDLVSWRGCREEPQPSATERDPAVGGNHLRIVIRCHTNPHKQRFMIKKMIKMLYLTTLQGAQPVLPSCTLYVKLTGEDCMPTGIVITNTDRTVDDIRVLADTCKDANQSRRLRAVCADDERGRWARLTLPRHARRVDLQTLCD